MSIEWTEYHCKSDEVLFLYNKKTGEHKWPDQYADEPLESEELDGDWAEYKCKSGETLFLYNKLTHEHKWPIYDQNNCTTGQEAGQKAVNGTNDTVLDSNERTNNMVPEQSVENVSQSHRCECCNTTFDYAHNYKLHSSSCNETSPEPLAKNVNETVGQDTNSLPGKGLVRHSSRKRLDGSLINALRCPSDKVTDDSCDKELGGPSSKEPLNDTSDKASYDFLRKGPSSKGSDVPSSAVPAGPNSKRADVPNSKGPVDSSRKRSGGPCSTGPYKCNYCEKSFSKAAYRIRHERNAHTGEKSFKCKHCDKAYYSEFYLKQHLFSHSDERPYTCPQCGKAFSREKDVKIHQRIHNKGDIAFTCSYCSKTLTTLSGMKYHERRFHTGKDEIYNCDQCDKIFRSNINLKAHKRVVHLRIKPHKCRYCSKAFAWKRYCTIHEEMHRYIKPYKCQSCNKEVFMPRKDTKQLSDEGTYNCNLCGKSFDCSRSLLRHERHVHIADRLKCQDCLQAFNNAQKTDSKKEDFCKISSATRIASAVTKDSTSTAGVKPYKCEFCDIEFTFADDQKKHLQDCRNAFATTRDKNITIDLTSPKTFTESVRPGECQFCKMKFVFANSLERHKCRNVGNNEERHRCNSCEKTFISLKTLRKHTRNIHESKSSHSKLRVHHDSKDYKCQQCGKTFATPSLLKQHEKTHNGIKPHKCRYCEKAFTIKSYRARHERVHFDVKIFKCEYPNCNKEYRTRKAYKTHECSHTGVMLYQCQYCTKQFSEYSQHKRHERNHTGERPYICTYCAKGFVSSTQCRSHEKTVHRILLNSSY